MLSNARDAMPEDGRARQQKNPANGKPRQRFIPSVSVRMFIVSRFPCQPKAEKDNGGTENVTTCFQAVRQHGG